MFKALPLILLTVLSILLIGMPQAGDGGDICRLAAHHQ